MFITNLHTSMIMNDKIGFKTDLGPSLYLELGLNFQKLKSGWKD